MTLSAKTTNEAGKTVLSHGPLTIDLSEMEGHLPDSRLPQTFDDVIDDGSQFAIMLMTIKGAYEDFVHGILKPTQKPESSNIDDLQDQVKKLKKQLAES